MIYPKINRILSKDELSEHFTITEREKQLISKVKKNENKLGFAVLFKTYIYLGYPPKQKKSIPSYLVKNIANQLHLDTKLFSAYKWKTSIFKHHLSIIRQYIKFRPFETVDKNNLKIVLIEKAYTDNSRKHLMSAAIKFCRKNSIDLPSEKELIKTINSSKKDFLDELYTNITKKLDDDIIKKMDECISSNSETEGFNWFKKPPGKLGMKTILKEISKLQYLREFNLKKNLFANISDKILNLLKNRAQAEDSYLMGRHHPPTRYGLLSIFLHLKKMEVADNIVTLFMNLANNIDKKSKTVLQTQLINTITKVFGTKKKLYKIAAAIKKNPDGSAKNVVYPVVSEKILDDIIAEYEDGDGDYEVSKIKVMKQKYTKHYRRMMKPVLDTLIFRANNPVYKSLLEGLEIVHKYIDSKKIYYPDSVNIPDGIITSKWEQLVIKEDDNKGPRVVRHYFEICVLHKLRLALKSKEVWVEDTFRYRNPDEDLPDDWSINRINYYNKINIPINADDFLKSIKKELIASLENANKYFSKKEDVYIYNPGGGERGYFRIPKIIKKPERALIKEIKINVTNKWGIIDLLDILLEAEKQVNFSSFFSTTAQRQVLNDDDVRKRLLLNLYSLGTNMGLKRIHSGAKPDCSYPDLLYFKQRFINPEYIRNAITSVTNRILEVRNPYVWGNTTTCASDKKVFNAWDQNLLADWNPHYRKTGVHVYWHVDTNSTCIYSQLKSIWASEVASMIEGLVNHDTEMRVEKNFVDSHGQSEVVFAICKFLGIELMPRLKKIKKEKLYLPDKNMADAFLNLDGVLARPIRWEIIEEQYDEMVKHITAILEKTGPVDSILKRFNSYNKTNPTYKAFIELGKAMKTIFLCKYLTDPAVRQEIHEGLNVVENWNSANSFICYGRQSELQSNDPHMQEMTILGLHLLQNSLILINTIMMDQIINQSDIISRMKPEDSSALTPLFTSNINPYGYFMLDLLKPSILEVA